MAQAKITLIGLENYLNPERSVFDNMVLPEGIDKDTLVGSILLRCQEFELLYSDPEFMTAAVNVWSRKNYWTFDKWVTSSAIATGVQERMPITARKAYDGWRRHTRQAT